MWHAPMPPQVRHVIYVSGLPFDFKEAKVRTAFARCGQVCAGGKVKHTMAIPA